MAKQGTGSIGTSSSMCSVTAPYLRAFGLTKTEKRRLANLRASAQRAKEDPVYAAQIKVKRQLAVCNSTQTWRSKKMKAQISLPKFSWDAETTDGEK